MKTDRIQQIEAYAEQMISGPFVVEAFRIAHDLPHVRRVYANAMRLAQAEGYPHLDRVAAAALLHDVGLPVVEKRGDHPRVGAELAAQYLQENELFAPDEIAEICEAIVYHGRLDGTAPLIHILRDADTLDLLGTVGIMRAFTSKAHKPVYLPEHPRGETWGLTAADFTQRFQAGLGMGPTILDQINFQLSCYENLATATAREWGRPLRDTMRQFVIQFAEEAAPYPQ
ncbi:MAG: HD domain-containing protein [Anaerolineaceae bacterium]|nr:HD domain-containing protein [Anaerolineaceae bacterium]